MCRIFSKVVTFIVISIAVILAIVVSVWHEQSLTYIIFVSRFFDVMLPILAVGALFKYLLTHHNCNCQDDECCKK